MTIVHVRVVGANGPRECAEVCRRYGMKVTKESLVPDQAVYGDIDENKLENLEGDVRIKSVKVISID